MAPERISVQDAGTYTVAADVWSLGMSLLEMAMGHYPYPSSEYDSVFAQLNAIVSGEHPPLDASLYSQDARHFVDACLLKNPRDRPTYSQLLQHPWLVRYEVVEVDVGTWLTTRLKPF